MDISYQNAQHATIKHISQIIDFSLVFTMLFLITSLYPDANWSSKYALLGLAGIILFLFISDITALYQSWQGASYQSECTRALVVWASVVMILLVVAYATKTTAVYSRVVIGFWFMTVPAVLCLWRGLLRLGLRKYRSKEQFTRSVAVLGANENGIQISKTIKESPWLGLKFTGFFDDRVQVEDRVKWQGEIKGSISTLISEAYAGNIDIVYISLPLTAQPRIVNVIEKLADTTTSVYLVPDFFIFSLFQGKWTNLSGIPVVNVFDTPFWGLDGWLKRLQDIVFSLIIMTIIAIPMLIIAMAVKLTTQGTVLFKQNRYGIDGRKIEVWKFRTMSVSEDGEHVQQAIKKDRRVTKLGVFLRKSSLDELPQFFNVLQGSMSIVGPRPHAVAHNEEYRKRIKGYMLRHTVKPGITGWAQINGWRGQTETLDKMTKRIEYDLWYIKHWSFWLDVKIILLTIIYGFINKNAY